MQILAKQENQNLIDLTLQKEAFQQAMVLEKTKAEVALELEKLKFFKNEIQNKMDILSSQETHKNQTTISSNSSECTTIETNTNQPKKVNAQVTRLGKRFDKSSKSNITVNINLS